MNDHVNTLAVRSDNSKAMNNHPNTTATRSDNGTKTGPENIKKARAHPKYKEHIDSVSKRVLLTNTATSDVFDFPSAREACRVLGLHQGHLCEVARGERKQHKGYTAVYL